MYKEIITKIINIAIEVYLKLDAFENMSVSAAYRFGLVYTFFACKFFYKIFESFFKLIVAFHSLFLPTTNNISLNTALDLEK